MLQDILDERRKKLEKYKAFADPYPARVKRDFPIANALKNFSSLQKNKKKLSLAGRITGLRKQGKLIFADIEDESGKIQAVLKEDGLRNFTLINETLDLGDFLNVQGVLFKTKKGEKSVLTVSAAIIAKALRPLPSKFYGLKDSETRLRERYLDLLLDPELKNLFRRKTSFWDAVRSFLKEKGFLEVETPVFESMPGGADAEPFITHHNALNENFYLRISLELPLKKIVVGGFEKIFEIGRVFRNEGVDQEHLQDYTQLELYAAYEDYSSLMDLVEKMLKGVIKNIFGSLTTISKGQRINWDKKWPKISYISLMKTEIGFDPREKSTDELKSFVRKEMGTGDKMPIGKGRLIDLIFKKLVRPKLIEPAFLINPPVEIEPLAKRLSEDPTLVERFQVMACGTELGKGFSELNDPIDQRNRFEEQVKLRLQGDKEAQRMDEEFLRALEYGLPPTAGFGMSERLFSVLMMKPIRETVIFPLLRSGKNL